MPVVLIVDDSATARETAGTVFLREGFDVWYAADGLSGVQQIRAGGVDCVICDIVMPRMNGFELVTAIRSEEQFLDLPILMLTSQSSMRLTTAAKRAGASGWMVKPFDPTLLVMSVRKLLDPQHTPKNKKMSNKINENSPINYSS